ncbi:uncharacterized protein PAC_06769 [Phialocephala subalpina]|uniref:Uncharacterized protein n=1 Tax=Phialocephala subalpina TaxID=576137 RepID=A0A1L7WVR7_9HELO|nr:uncharacterized protein PAC_06769 [Phialocephala subalpina]
MAEQTARRSTEQNILLANILAELKVLAGQLKNKEGEHAGEVETLGGRKSEKEILGKRDEEEPKGYSLRSLAAIPGLRTAVPDPLVPEDNSARDRHILTNEEINHIYGNDWVHRIDSRRSTNLADLSALERLANKSSWIELIGSIWEAPEDGRLPFTFQKRQLIRNYKEELSPGSGISRFDATHDQTQQQLEHIANQLKSIPEVRSSALPEYRTAVCIEDYLPDGTVRIYRSFWSSKKDIDDPYCTPEPASRSGPQPPHDQSTISHHQAPWRRHVVIKGLEYTSPFLILSPRSSYGTHIFEGYRDYLILINAAAAWANLERLMVSITFLELVNVCDADIERFELQSWKTGIMHSDTREHNPSLASWRPQFCVRTKPGYCVGLNDRIPKPSVVRKVRKCAWTILAVIELDELTYWTLLELLPFGFHDFLIPAKYERWRGNVLLYILHGVEHGVAQVIWRWEDLLSYFNQFLTEGEVYLNPQQHDNLLVDDESFSRSKKYFWAITTLTEIETLIEGNMKQISKILLRRAPESAELEYKERLKSCRSDLEKSIGKLLQLQRNFATKRKEATYLRDGLFNASSVMETRAANLLGENVRLLTIVSIMFLPLSFCMSVWSVNNQIFSLHNLWITATVIALSTYMLVFNINIAMSRCYSVSHRISQKIIESMKQDIDQEWKDRASIFGKFAKPQQAEHKPSNWRLVQYVVERRLWPAGAIRTLQDFDWKGSVTFWTRRKEELPSTEPPPPATVIETQTPAPPSTPRAVHSPRSGNTPSSTSSKSFHSAITRSPTDPPIGTPRDSMETRKRRNSDSSRPSIVLNHEFQREPETYQNERGIGAVV